MPVLMLPLGSPPFLLFYDRSCIYVCEKNSYTECILLHHVEDLGMDGSHYPAFVSDVDEDLFLITLRNKTSICIYA